MSKDIYEEAYLDSISSDSRTQLKGRLVINKLISDSFLSDDKRDIYLNLRARDPKTFFKIERYYKPSHRVNLPTPEIYISLKDKGVNSDYLSNIKNMLIDHWSRARDNGRILPERFFNEVKSRKIIKRVIADCVDKDDVEAWKCIRDYKPVKRLLEDKTFLTTVIRGSEPKPGSCMFNEIYENNRLTYPEKIRWLCNISSNESIEGVKSIYDPSMAKSFGHFIISNNFRTAKVMNSEVGFKFTEMMIKDGADFFVGFMLSREPYFIYEPLLDREIKHHLEADFMENYLDKSKWTNEKSKKTLKSMIDEYRKMGVEPKKDKVIGNDSLDP